MNTEKIGEIFIDGKILSADTAPLKEIEEFEQLVRAKQSKVLDRIDNVLSKI